MESFSRRLDRIGSTTTLNSALQYFTVAERQAVVGASRDPLVRRAARDLQLTVGDAGFDAEAAVVAHQQLAAAVADALAGLAPDAPEKGVTSRCRPRCWPSARQSL